MSHLPDGRPFQAKLGEGWRHVEDGVCLFSLVPIVLYAGSRALDGDKTAMLVLVGILSAAHLALRLSDQQPPHHLSIAAMVILVIFVGFGR